MTAPTVPNDSIVLGPGVLLKAPVGTSLPTHTVAGSKFTDTWPVGWNAVGVTETGHEWTYQPSTGTVEVAEYLYPLRIVTTGVQIGVNFQLSQITAKNYAFALNGGTYTLLSGTGATSLSKVSPPTVGSEVRTMLGWESDDGTERVVWYQAFQGGQITVGHRKGAENAFIPLGFQVEQPTSGNPFDIWIAGTTRVGV